MKFNIELDGAEEAEDMARLVAALVVLYDLQPPKGIGERTAHVDAEVHPLGDGPAEQVSTDSDLPPITTSRPPPPPVQQPESPIDTAALGFGVTHGSPELDEDARKLAALGGDPGLTMQVPPPPPADDVDSAGVRWDAAKHTANKSKKGDGTWKAKPGLSKEAVAESNRVDNIPPPPPVATAAPGAPEDPAALFDWADTNGVTIARLQAAFKAVGLVDANGEGSIPLLLSRPDFTGAVYAELTK
ncbi:MAG: hypothetical protein RSG92_15270 [Pseudomonas sp.]